MDYQIRLMRGGAKAANALNSSRDGGDQAGTIANARKASLLIVDEDTPSIRRLSAEMAKRGFDPFVAASIAEAREVAVTKPPAFAVVELRLPDGHGLRLIEGILAIQPDCRIIVLTSFGSIASAIGAVKIGVVNYLTKPVDVDEVYGALLTTSAVKPTLPKYFMSPERVRWEHIQRVYELCNHNKAKTARKLKIHRRSLQRILSKDAPI